MTFKTLLMGASLAALTASGAAAETWKLAVTDVEGMERLQTEWGPFKAALEEATDDTFDPDRSAPDLAVEFAPMSPGEHSDSYFGLKEALEELFQRPVDLVEYGPIRNPYFRRALEESQIMLYEAA